MSENKKIMIPDNPAGRLAFDVFHRLAVKMCETANGETRDFANANFPNWKTIRRDYINRQYRRVIDVEGEYIAVIYDFKERTIAAQILTDDELRVIIIWLLLVTLLQSSCYRASLG